MGKFRLSIITLGATLAAAPAMAQGIYVPDNSRSIYGGMGSSPPTYHYQQMAPPIVQPRPQLSPPRSVVCYTYGNQTVCN